MSYATMSTPSVSGAHSGDYYDVTVTATYTPNFKYDTVSKPTINMYFKVTVDGITVDAGGYTLTGDSQADTIDGTYTTVHNVSAKVVIKKTDNARNVGVTVSCVTDASITTDLGEASASTTTTIPAGYKPPSIVSLVVNSSTTNSINVTFKWKTGNKPLIVWEVKTINNNDGWVSPPNGSPIGMAGLQPNTYYHIEGRIHDGQTELKAHAWYWTHPEMGTITLTLAPSLEHDKINVVVTPKVASNYDQYSYKIDSWSAWSGKTYNFSNLTENTLYRVYAKMRNTSSGFESDAISSTIRTWYDPLTDLRVNLTDRWYWYLAINSSYTYHGTISKYEFAIGDTEGYQNKGTVNAHSKGTKNENASGNLAPHTMYNCYARLTDNHGRKYTANNQYYTLDDRLAYIIEPNGNSEFVQAYIVEPNGTTKQMTPDLVAVVEPNGSTTVFPNKFP